MKKTLPLILLFALLVYLLPMITLFIPQNSDKASSSSIFQNDLSSANSALDENSEESLLILDEDTDTVMTVSIPTRLFARRRWQHIAMP